VILEDGPGRTRWRRAGWARRRTGKLRGPAQRPRANPYGDRPRPLRRPPGVPRSRGRAGPL